jgi:hypothetical protein
LYKERDQIVAQFKPVAERKAILDEENKKLVNEQKEIKQKIQDFDGRRQEASTEVEKAVASRMRAQSAKNHWTTRMTEELKKVEAAKEAESVVQEEFTVRLIYVFVLVKSFRLFKITATRTGLLRLRIIASESRIRVL